MLRRLCVCLSLSALLTPLTFAQQPGVVSTISTMAGNGTAGYTGDNGPAIAATLNQPQSVAADGAGNVYIADFSNNRIRKVTDGIITSLPPQNNGASYGITVDSAGNLYVPIDHSIVKRAPDGTTTVVAGTGIAGYSGDGGPATLAQLFLPYDVAVDAAGNIYIADFNNGRIRKVGVDGFMTTVAGNGTCCYDGDGGLATAAALNHPESIAVDKAGNLYIADGSARIRKVSADGIITTVVGNGSCCYEGDGGPATGAQLFSPRGLVVDAVGNLYFGDGSRVRKVSAGTISTIAGTTTPGFSGDGGPATAALLGFVRDLSFDGAGNLLVVDTNNQRVRRISGVGGFSQVGMLAQIASGGGWKTTFVLVNSNSAAVSGLLNFRSDNGGPLTLPLVYPQTGFVTNVSSTSFTVAPKAVLLIETEASSLVAGWADVQSGNGLRVFAALRFRSPGLPDSEGVVGMDTVGFSSDVISFDNTAGFQTGIAIANQSETQAIAAVTIRDDAGASLAVGQFSIPALGHTSLYLTSAFPQAAGRRGTIEVQAPAGIRLGAISIRFNPSGTFIFLPR